MMARAATTTMIQIATGTPNQLFTPITLKPVLWREGVPARLGNVPPLLRRSARPRATYSTPSVAMKGATFSLVTSSPLMAPTAAPTRMPDDDHDGGEPDAVA